jgi:hypothetical protein
MSVETIVDEVIAEFPEQWEEYKAVRKKEYDKAIGYLVGQVVRQDKQLNPGMVKIIMLWKLGITDLPYGLCEPIWLGDFKKRGWVAVKQCELGVVMRMDDGKL